MPTFEFKCNDCNKEYEALTKFDKTAKYKSVSCPDCGSKRKVKHISVPGYAFTNAVGTDRWTSDRVGHDYRCKSYAPVVAAQRKHAEAMSHMGANPYSDTIEQDLKLDTGIHDAESRPGLT